MSTRPPKKTQSGAARARTRTSRVPEPGEILAPLDVPDPHAIETYQRIVAAVLGKYEKDHGVPVDGLETTLAYSRIAVRTYGDAVGLPAEYAEAARLRALDGTGWPRARGAGSIQEEAREKRDLLDVPRPPSRPDRVRRGGTR